MTDSVFFDTDCICAFLWVGNECLLEKMYPERIVIPQQVYDEINRPAIFHLKARIDQLVARGSATIQVMDIESEEYLLYRDLTTISGKYKVIGRGEAASIALAKTYDGILGSNNLRDVAPYVKEFSLKHVTTGGILVQAFNQGLITEQQGNVIWQEMLKKRRQIGATSFSEFLQNNK